MERNNKGLHRFVKDRAGDAYRAAFAYESEDWTALYVREDLRTNSLRERIPDIVERARESDALLQEEEYPPLGRLTATTELHDSGVLIHLWEGEETGAVISLDRDAARRMAGFVTECLYILESPPSPRYGGTPTSDKVGEG